MIQADNDDDDDGIHEISCYFIAELYQDMLYSINRATHTPKMQSWFLQVYFPIKNQFIKMCLQKIESIEWSILWLNLKFVDKVGNRCYRKEKSTAWSLLFLIESVTSFANRFQLLIFVGHSAV